ncbi:flavodoxin family protein [Lachnospiraceae bacterium ZAX-1]
MSKIMAFSGTHIKNGNIEKAMLLVLDSIGVEYEFIRLAELNMKQCTACIGCADDNRCVQDDDVNPILEKIMEADGLIIGAFPTFGSLNALTKTFIERLFALRHNYNYPKGKVAAAVIGGSTRQSALESYFDIYFRQYQQANYQGALVIDGAVPCLTCGYGETCDMSGYLFRFGADAKITPNAFYDFNKDENAMSEAVKLGHAIKEHLGGDV